MSLYGSFKKPGPNGFGYTTPAEEVTEGLDLSGKTYLLTGSNSGIGLETLRVLGLRGAHVIAAARTEDKARDALSQVSATGTPVACELSEPGSVRACIDAVQKLDRPLDGIIGNAGIMALPKRELKHGMELQFLTNHVGHFILINGLLDALTDDGRVVVVSSDAHRGAPKEGIRFDDLAGDKDYSPWGHYGQSKLANILFARQLSGRLRAGQTANSVHPGVIQTNLGRHMGRVVTAVFYWVGSLFLKTTPQGAATQCHVATHPDAASKSGEYWADCNVATPSPLAQDDGLAEKLWARSEEIAASV